MCRKDGLKIFKMAEAVPQIQFFFDESRLVKQSHTANYQTEELQRGFRMHKLSSLTVEKYATYHQKINFFYVLLLLELE